MLIVQLLVCVAILNTFAGLYRPSGPRTALDEFPALATRTLIAWCASAALLAALHPTHALSLTTLLAGSATQLLIACCGRAVVHGYRRRTAGKRLTSALVVGTGRRAVGSPRCSPGIPSTACGPSASSPPWRGTAPAPRTVTRAVSASAPSARTIPPTPTPPPQDSPC